MVAQVNYMPCFFISTVFIAKIQNSKLRNEINDNYFLGDDYIWTASRKKGYVDYTEIGTSSRGNRH